MRKTNSASKIAMRHVKDKFKINNYPDLSDRLYSVAHMSGNLSFPTHFRRISDLLHNSSADLKRNFPNVELLHNFSKKINFLYFLSEDVAVKLILAIHNFKI